MEQKDKIIILGAGLSGLYSAFLLQEQGYEVLILEVRDRVGDPGYSENQILDQLAFLLDNSLAKTPKKIDRKNWTEDSFSGGCYFCVPPIDSFYNNKQYLTTPANGTYFAGAETAAVWMGYMEGALESAERTIAQITSSE